MTKTPENQSAEASKAEPENRSSEKKLPPHNEAVTKIIDLTQRARRGRASPPPAGVEAEPTQGELQVGEAPAAPVEDKQEVPASTTELGDLRGPQQLLIIELLEPERGKNTRYPTLLTRQSIFAPVKRREILDTAKGEVIETPWGTVTRKGEGLDIYDEDTLIALIRLCSQHKVTGPRDSLPIPVTRKDDNTRALQEPARESVELVTVIMGGVTAYQICKMLGRGLSGPDLKKTRQSLERLADTRLKFYDQANEQVAGIGFFNYAGDADFRGEIRIQFDPYMTRLLQTYTYINLDVRRHLTDVGKALHRFLSSQPRYYEIGLDKLQGILRYRGRPNDFRAAVSQALKRLRDLGWARGEIAKNRDGKFKLTVRRLKNGEVDSDISNEENASSGEPN